MKAIEKSNAWVYAAALAALLPALLLRDVTPDNELRYLSIADEAIGNGSLFCFSNHGEIYADKPPLYLWIVMLARMLFGQNCAWFIGLFSLIPMLICGRIMDRWAAPMLTPRQRTAALLMLFTCGFFPGLALTLRMDMLMTMWILLALRSVWLMARTGPSRLREALLGLFSFMALFTKGPLGVLIPLLGSAAWLASEKQLPLMRRIWGWPAWSVLLAGCALWFGGVYAEGGAPYLDNLLFHQTVDRSVNAFTHARPWWYYLTHMWYILAPWSLLIAWLCFERRAIALKTPFRRMMAAVFITTLLMLSCISSKLQVYLLPAIPFAVYLGASLLESPALIKAVDATALTLLALIFAASWLIPRLNPSISYGPACRQAAALNPARVYVHPSVRRGENIDAYFSVPVTMLSEADSTFTLPQRSVLLTAGSHGKKLSIMTSDL